MAYFTPHQNLHKVLVWGFTNFDVYGQKQDFALFWAGKEVLMKTRTGALMIVFLALLPFLGSCALTQRLAFIEPPRQAAPDLLKSVQALYSQALARLERQSGVLLLDNDGLVIYIRRTVTVAECLSVTVSDTRSPNPLDIETYLVEGEKISASKVTAVPKNNNPRVGDFFIKFRAPITITSEKLNELAEKIRNAKDVKVFKGSGGLML